MTSNLYMFTVHKSDGQRIGLGVKDNLEQVSLLGKRDSECLGPDFTFKTWECKEVEPMETKKSAD